MAEVLPSKMLWEPSQVFQEKSTMKEFMTWLEETKGLSFEQYDSLWKWSVSNIENFWSNIWDFFEIKGNKGDQTVLSGEKMPEIQWFPTATLNYAEHAFRKAVFNKAAIIYQSELRPQAELTWDELRRNTAAIASYLKSIGITAGDRVVAYASNIHETLTAFLACASIGAVWSSCAPEFGMNSVIDRFKQVEPKVLIAIDGYQYGGKKYDRLNHVKQIQTALPTLQKTIIIPYLHDNIATEELENVICWNQILQENDGATLTFEQVSFNHPLWILYSSGTTGKPKAIVQSQGGILLEHLKCLGLHIDVREDDRFFWYSTTGWMMWNLAIGGLLTGATVLLYDGNPGYPNYDTLWRFAESTQMTAFGTSASFIMACMKEGIKPKERFNLSHLKSIGSTGSPLPANGFDWIYEQVKEDVWLYSTSGGTDVCSGFLGGCPLVPVYSGEIQVRALGAAVRAFNEQGEEVVDEIGELVLTEPLPSMPIYFWNDKDGEKYRESYFDVFPHIWRHGDFLKVTPRGSAIIYGRSDATINRGGIRMGTSEIYGALDHVPEIMDSLIVDIRINAEQSYMPLFVVLKEGEELTDELKARINRTIREHCSPRYIPNDIFLVSELPKTLNGKKLEVPIKKILMGVPIDHAVNEGSLLNPQSLQYFVDFQVK